MTMAEKVVMASNGNSNSPYSLKLDTDSHPYLINNINLCSSSSSVGGIVVAEKW